MITNTTDAIFAFISEYVQEHGFPPSQREIAEGCYVTRGAVPRHLKKLEDQNRITRIPGVPRSIRICNGHIPRNGKNKK